VWCARRDDDDLAGVCFDGLVVDGEDNRAFLDDVTKNDTCAPWSFPSKRAARELNARSESSITFGTTASRSPTPPPNRYPDVIRSNPA
jgi:hypothetical protein